MSSHYEVLIWIEKDLETLGKSHKLLDNCKEIPDQQLGNR